MSEPVLNRRQSREVDRLAIETYGLPGIVLMENAGRGAVEMIVRLGLPGPYLICCGKGNNAGDGFVIARHLDNRGEAVRVLVWADESELRGDALINFRVIQASGIPLEILGNESALPRLRELLAGAGCVIDALLGTGAKGEPRPPLAEVIDALNAAGTPIVAIDLPSGLDCDTGLAGRHTIRAAHTCSFVARKAGFDSPDAAAFTGQVHVVEIGAPRRAVADAGA